MMMMMNIMVRVIVMPFILMSVLIMMTSLSPPVPGGPWSRATLLSPTSLGSTPLLDRVRLTVMAAIRSLFTLVEKIRLSLEEI